MEKIDKENKSLRRHYIDALEQIIPSCITETQDEQGMCRKSIDLHMLQQILSDEIIDGRESYVLNWVGKKAAIIEANRPTGSIIRPYREESINWNETQNLYIEGDNLEVLKILQESYLNRVNIIYIDPPYNTGKDFIYKDVYRKDKNEYEAEAGYYNEDGEKLVLNSDSAGRFHSDWCSMIYSRLLLARNLLTEDGILFISIDDHENANLIKICNEVFGESCFVCSAIWRSSDNSNNDAKQFSVDHNYTLIYSKKPFWQPNKGYDSNKRSHFKNPNNDPKGPWFDGNPVNSPNFRENLRYTIEAPNGNIIQPPKNGWRWSRETMQQKMDSGEIYFNEGQTNIKRKTYLCDMEGLPPSSLWIDLDVTGHNRQAKYELLELMPEDVFDTPKPVKLLKYIISLYKNNSEAIIMDFFSGSGTTADAVMQLNAEDGGSRKYIMVQLPEQLDLSLRQASNDKKRVLKNAISLCDKKGFPHLLSEIAKERIRRAAKKIHEEYPDASFDDGFRVFKVDSSNMNDVGYSADGMTQDLLSQTTSNIKADRTDLDLLFDCLLKEGVEITYPYSSEVIDGFTVHDYNNGALIACFDENVSENVMRVMAERKPIRAIFRDSSFKTDADRINVEELFKLISPDTTVKVI